MISKLYTKQISELGEGVKIPQALFTSKRKEEKRLIRKRKFDKEKRINQKKKRKYIKEKIINNHKEIT